MRKKRGVVFVFIILNSLGGLYAQFSQNRKISIEEMFELAESNSKSIRIYAHAEKEAGEAVKVAKNAYLPSVDVSVSANYLGDGWMSDRDYSNGTNAPMPHFGNNFALEASQVVYAGGAIRSAVEIAGLKQQLASLDKDKNRQDIRFLLVGNYLELYKLCNEAEVYLLNIEQTKRLLSDIRAKESQGIVLKNDITRYELQLKSLELALTQVENSKIIVNNQLVTVLGLPQETVIEVDRSVLDDLPHPSSEILWQETASEISPLLKQAHLGIELSEQNEKIVRSERLPWVSLLAGDHLDGPITIEVPPINKNFNYWYVGVRVKYNLASLYKSNKTSRMARISTQKAIESRQLLEENIRTEVKATYVRFLESFTIYDTQMKSLELAVQNYNVVNNRYLNELALITDMLDATSSKLSAQLQVANARINILFNYYKLKKVSGTI